jgi:hypothetical protein
MVLILFDLSLFSSKFAVAKHKRRPQETANDRFHPDDLLKIDWFF